MTIKKRVKKREKTSPAAPGWSQPTESISEKRRHFILIAILASLSAIGPFSTDMYLPAFPAMAKGLETDIAHIGLSLTSYFIGLAVGQICYGPLMDRFGRKKPLMIGLLVYIVASLWCAFSSSIETLVAMRFFVAIGGCVGMAGSRAVVRDIFSGSEVARVLSLLMMVFGVAPVIAPSIGSLVVSALGWRYIFFVLTAIAILIFVATAMFLRESKEPDASVSLHPISVVQEYVSLFKNRTFVIYVLVCSTVTAGFFSYITGSPAVYMKLFGLTEREFGLIYSVNVIGLIIASQTNRMLLKKFESAEVLFAAAAIQFCFIVALFAGTLTGIAGKNITLILIFCHVFCFGLSIANVVSLALQPFEKNAGSASGLIGCIQMVAGAVASGLVSCLYSETALSMVGVMAGSACIGFVLLCAFKFFRKNSGIDMSGA